MNDFEALVALAMIPSIGSISIQRFLKAFTRPRDIFKASTAQLALIEGMTPRKINAIKAAEKENDVGNELRQARDHNITIVTILDSGYPEQLKNIYDPPAVLYVKGSLLAQDYNSVAIVGSRRATFYGLSVAQRLAGELSEAGITVVSGLARGIDTAGHKGALEHRGRTIAVLGSGLLTIYPPENKSLADEIAGCGALVSEFSLHTPPLAKNFPRRNRIISGLSLGVVVVEAARNSGALITAEMALQQSREVFAIPGKMDSQTSIGTNRLIKDGAALIAGVDDIIDEIKIKLRPSLCTEQPIRRPAEEKQVFDGRTESVYALLSDAPLHIDEIIQNSNLNMNECSLAIMKLQLQRLIKELPGKNFVRAH